MSKQSEAKERQGYTRILKNCAHCKYFTCDIDRWGGHEKERNLRCSLGGFKVHKTAVCDEFVTES